MRVFSLFFLFLLLVIRWSFAQQFNLLGDSGSESFVAVEYLPGGGFVVGGLSRAAGAGSDDISLHFFDEDGKLRHCHYFGCALSDQVFSLAVAKNGDILLGGQTHCASGTGNRAIIMRVDPYGRKLWKKTFHARAAYAIMEVDDEKIAIAASKDVPDKRADFSLSLWQKNGNILWISTEGTIYKDYAFGLTTTADNGFLLGGIKNGFHSPEGHGYPIQDSDLLFIKYDQSGAFLWQKELGEAGHDFLNKMLPSEDGNIYVVGSTQGHGKQSFDAFILKIDQNANPVWQATFGGEDFEYGMDMCLDTAGNILVCGVTNSNTGNQKTDLFVAKYDAEGNELWYKQMGSSDSEYAHSICVNEKGESLIVGYAEKDNDKQYLLLKLNSDGEIISLYPLGQGDAFLFFAPNPTRDIVRISVATNSFCQDFEYRLYDASIKLINSGKAYGELLLDLSDLPAGLYPIQVVLDNGEVLREKIIKVH